MSAKKLRRSMGVVINCDGSDHQDCMGKIQTANVVVKHNRAAAVKLGWGRGLRKYRKRLDYCPTHMTEERKLFEAEQATREADKRAKDEVRKAKWAAKGKTPPPKKPSAKRRSKPVSLSSPVASDAI
jgi:hypothetical protein